MYCRLLRCVYPINKVPTLARREFSPRRLCCCVSCESLVKTRGYDHITARAPPSGCKNIACFCDPPRTCFRLFGSLYPMGEIPTRDRREILPPRFCFRRSGEGLAKIRRHSFHGPIVPH